MLLPTFMRAAILLLAGVASVTAADAELALSYPGHYDGLDGIELFWRATSTHLELAIKAPASTGWVGFGLAEPTVGGMAGADIVFASVKDGQVVLSDTFATKQMTPTSDCSQDWTATSGAVVGDDWVVHLRRLLVTGDGEDRAVATTLDNVGRPTRVILATGAVSDGGVYLYHGANRVAVKLNLLNPTESLDELAAYRVDPDMFSFELRKSWWLLRSALPACDGEAPASQAQAGPLACPPRRARRALSQRR